MPTLKVNKYAFGKYTLLPTCRKLVLCRLGKGAVQYFSRIGFSKHNRQDTQALNLLPRARSRERKFAEGAKYPQQVSKFHFCI
jgi:hypothetical protein